MSNQKGFEPIELLIMIITIIIIIFSIFRGVFVDSAIAVRALEKQGYDNIQVLEKNWLFVGLKGCDSGDAAKFITRATNSAKKEVTVNVCAGWPFKGATIRVD